FAHNAQHLIALDCQRHAIDSLENALIQMEVGAQILDFEQDVVLAHHCPYLYGSAASRRPSPTKLNISTATSKNRPGVSIQGCTAMLRTFCASCISVPQLTAGGRMPRPRKLRAVSARIMPGIASVRWTIR